jgi:hypothetical protein
MPAPSSSAPIADISTALLVRTSSRKVSRPGSPAAYNTARANQAGRASLPARGRAYNVGFSSGAIQKP